MSLVEVKSPVDGLPRGSKRCIAAIIGPWLTVAAIVINVALYLVRPGSLALELVVALIQMVVVLGLTSAGLTFSVIGVSQTTGRQPGSRSAKVGVWIASIVLASNVVGLCFDTVGSFSGV